MNKPKVVQVLAVPDGFRVEAPSAADKLAPMETRPDDLCEHEIQSKR
jgi:hypothetical protein